MKIQFSGANFINTKYLGSGWVSNIIAFEESGVYPLSNNPKYPDVFTVVTDSEKNLNAEKLDKTIRELAKEASELSGVPVGRIYRFDELESLSDKALEKNMKRLMKQDNRTRRSLHAVFSQLKAIPRGIRNTFSKKTKNS